MQFHQDSAFDAQLKRTFGYCVQGGAELSECLSVAKKIKSRDYNGWYEAWSFMADQLNRAATQEMQQQSNTSAGEKLLRASNYYRTAYFFLEENPEDKRIATSLELSKKAFKSALELLTISHVPLKIPFDGGFLPGYLYLSNDPTSKLLIDTGGGDSILEELYFISGAAALKRSYHCLTFEGPGQGSVLRLQKMPFRHDWEVVIKAVIDNVENNYPEFTSNIALRGDSFGGYLAARAAAYEKRIKACILNPGILNPMGSLEKLNSKWLQSVLFFLFPRLKFKIRSRFMRFGARSVPEMIERCKAFNMDQEVKMISCPVFIIDNEEEHITKGEAFKLYEQLQCPKKYVLFTKDQCSGGHCQPLAQLNTQEMIFDWLDTIFK
ncbi:MAG: alpha/beta hydrolase [Parachlamydiaceae bacterium]|nr:alpha/beta hydrolase [Parachlamydiaceae bacterium]